MGFDPDESRRLRVLGRRLIPYPDDRQITSSLLGPPMKSTLAYLT